MPEESKSRYRGDNSWHGGCVFLVCRLAVHHQLRQSGMVEDYTWSGSLAVLFGPGSLVRTACI